MQMPENQNPPPESPTAIGMQTGMCVPGLDLTDIRGTLEEALVTPPGRIADRYPSGNPDGVSAAGGAVGRAGADLDVVPGQSGAEGMAALPHSDDADPWDGP
jgi:hypothetical protein